MPRYIISINIGFGEDHQVVEAENLNEAQEQAYNWFDEECQNQHTCNAQPYSVELAKELELDTEEDEGDAA